jgi:hypothetical protein
MKKIAILTLFTWFLCHFAFAQEEKRGITKAEFYSVKMLTVNNLEKDTYIKTDKGFILDRYESRPAYKFNFSDGIERRIYLYKVFEADKMKEVAMLAFFVTPKDGQILKLCIPNLMAQKEVWGLYIDDLKDNDKKISGFSTCVAFVLSREFSGGGEAGSKTSGEDYEYCFPADSQIKMADLSEKNIENVKIGEKIISINPQTKLTETAEITAIQVHENKDFALTGIVLFPVENEMVSLTGYTESIFLEATPNHPVLTEAGKKIIGDLQTGDILYVFENQLVKKYQVAALFAKSRKVKRVYNLTTDKGTYLVNNMLIFGK